MNNDIFKWMKILMLKCLMVSIRIKEIIFKCITEIRAICLRKNHSWIKKDITRIKQEIRRTLSKRNYQEPRLLRNIKVTLIVSFIVFYNSQDLIEI